MSDSYPPRDSASFEARESRLQEIRREAERERRAISSESARLQPRHSIASASTGYYGTPALKAPAWTWEVPIYFFVGGAAGASAVVASVARWSGADSQLVQDARWLAAIGGAVSPALLIADLGMPSRFLNMLRVFKIQSPMSVGSWTLVAFSSSAAASVFLGAVRRRNRGNGLIICLENSAEIFAALSGLVLCTYTGVLIGATAIPVWNANVSLLPLHFAASGLSSAVSILELRGHRSRALQTLGIASALTETVIDAAIELRRKPVHKPLRKGFTGWLMRAAGLLAGPVPLILRLLAGKSNSPRSVKLRKAAAISAIAGSVATRIAWVQAGKVSARDPSVPLGLPQLPDKASTKQEA